MLRLVARTQVPSSPRCRAVRRAKGDEAQLHRDRKVLRIARRARANVVPMGACAGGAGWRSEGGDGVRRCVAGALPRPFSPWPSRPSWPQPMRRRYWLDFRSIIPRRATRDGARTIPATTRRPLSVLTGFRPASSARACTRPGRHYRRRPTSSSPRCRGASPCTRHTMVSSARGSTISLLSPAVRHAWPDLPT